MASFSKLMQLILIATTAHMSYRKKLWIVNWIKLALSLTFQWNYRCAFPVSVSKVFLSRNISLLFLGFLWFFSALLCWVPFNCLSVALKQYWPSRQESSCFEWEFTPEVSLCYLFNTYSFWMFIPYMWSAGKDGRIILKLILKASSFFRDLTPRSAVKVNPIFLRTYCLHIQGLRVSQTWNQQQRCRMKRV